MKYFLTWLFLPSLVLAANSSFNVTFRTPDTTPPSVPLNLTAVAVSSSQINLNWSPSTDVFGVAGYRVFRDAVFIATSTTVAYSDTGLAASTTYAYTVSAFDASFNESAQSATATATTIAPSSATTPTPTTTAGRISGSCRPCAPCDQFRLFCGDEIFLPVAVSDLVVRSLINRIVLSWRNPNLSQFIGVRIIRSERGFPKDAYDGALVFEGLADSFIDRQVVLSKDYFYGVFAVYLDGLLAAPAVGLGRLSATPDLAVEPPVFKLPIFTFTQNKQLLTAIDGQVMVDGGLPISVSLAGAGLPKEVRVIVLSLIDKNGALGKWVLVYQRDRDIYELVLPAVSAGVFTVIGAAYDGNFFLMSESQPLVLIAKEPPLSVARPKFGLFAGGLKTGLMWWLLILLLLLLFILYRLWRRHHHEQSLN